MPPSKLIVNKILLPKGGFIIRGVLLLRGRHYDVRFVWGVTNCTTLLFERFGECLSSIVLQLLSFRRTAICRTVSSRYIISRTEVECACLKVRRNH